MRSVAPLCQNLGWQVGGTGREKEPPYRRQTGNRILSILKVCPRGLQVTREIKVKGTCIPRYCTCKDTWGAHGAGLAERCDKPRCFPLVSTAWSHLVLQQAVGDRLKWHRATSRDTVTLTRGSEHNTSHIPTQSLPQLDSFLGPCPY